MLPARPLTLETYRRFFLDPWSTRITLDQLNQILVMHGFAQFQHTKKAKIMERLVGQVDLMPPRRSTLHGAAPSVASTPPSAAVITAAQARDDVEAIGWAECPIGCVAAFAASAPSGDALEPVERVPRPADFVLAGRRPRSKRTRRSAYGPRDVAAGAESMKLKQAKVVVKEEEEPELVSPPPSPPPMWMRSPTPPPPASPPPPEDVAPPPPPPPASPPPPEDVVPPPPPQDVAPPPPPPCQPQPTLAPIPAPVGWGTPMVLPHPSQQQLFWGLPLPTRPAAQPWCPAPPPPPPPGWCVPTPPPSFPAPFWGAPVMLPPLPPHVAWRWPPPTTAPHWGSMLSAPEHPSLMQLQRSPPPPLLLLQQPPPHFQGQPLPSLIRAPPFHPPTLQHYPPPHFSGQHPQPAFHHAVPPPMQLQRPLSH